MTLPFPSSGPAARPPCFLTVCIPTYRRLDRLALLLDDLMAQTRLPQQIVVVDNDARGSAREVVDEFRAQAGGIEVVYDIQPQLNIALTRNRGVAHARGTWIAFIDDDERALPNWLAHLVAAQTVHGADGVLAPVHPVLPPNGPAWMRKIRLFDAPRIASGDEVPLAALRGGNLLLAGRHFHAQGLRFDPAFGTTGGEDDELLMRLRQAGHRLVWCEEAAVLRPIEPSRLQPAWVLRRALRSGQDDALHFNAGRLGPVSGMRRAGFAARACAMAVFCAARAAAGWPAGRQHGLYWLAQAVEQLGKVSVLWSGRRSGPGQSC